ncbi:MAG TPA: galactosyldiacylglycerol synthase, partial [bacterium]|nr:galactosyldiacylglycerol synthase [bacterium]
EALAKHLPMLIFRPIPGQEEGNTQFLVERGAALAAASPRALRVQLETLLTHPERLAAMRQAAAGLGRPDAAEVVVDELAQLARIANRSGVASHEPLALPSATP